MDTTRHELRIPTYARLDLRLNRTFTRRDTRLTLFAEVLNVLDRNNVRQGTPGINAVTFQATHFFDQLFRECHRRVCSLSSDVSYLTAHTLVTKAARPTLALSRRTDGVSRRETWSAAGL